MTLKTKINNLNETIALKSTLIFGTMWTTYAFFLYGIIPALYPQHMSEMLYWSNTIQLWSLPLIMVGTNVLSRRFNQMITDMWSELKDIYNWDKDVQANAKTQRDEMMVLLKDIREMHDSMKCVSCDGQPDVVTKGD